MSEPFVVNGRRIAPGHPTYIIAELSANHDQKYDKAVELIRAAKAAGADAVKLQTYTADTMTIDADNEHFRIRGGTIWDGGTLHKLYQQAYTPWEWQPKLMDVARSLEMDLFSTPFDATSVDFLEAMRVPVYKIASFEVVDVPLLRKIGATRKPVIMSTGMATLAEIDEAVTALRAAGAPAIALLKCTSSYPAPAEEANLRTIPHLAEAFGVVAGLSDHTMDVAVPAAAVVLGACIIEKHFTLDRREKGPDSEFSLEPHEFKAMVDAVRTTERALGTVHYGVTARDAKSRAFRRSIFVVEDVKAGDEFTEKNVRVIRPADGLHPRHLDDVLGAVAAEDVPRGTPLSWRHVRSR